VTDENPRRISDREVPLAIDGYFMPMHAPNAPVLIGMPGTDDLFVFVFSTGEKLDEAMKTFSLAYAHVSRVSSGKDLIAELNAMNTSGGRPYRIRLAVDPYKADNGKARFTEPLSYQKPQ
jgi:hypothetical protein